MRLVAPGLILLLCSSALFPLLETAVEDASAESLSGWTRQFYLHDGAVLSAGEYDWMNSSGPANPPSGDYDSDGLPGITIKKDTPATPPPQRSHHWYLYPAAGVDTVLTGDLIAHVWAKSRNNDSGTLVRADFSDMAPGQFDTPLSWTPIASNFSSMNGPVYSEFQMVNVSVPIPSGTYILPQGHFLVLTVCRGDSINDWLLVSYDQTDYDSFVEIETSTFISADSAWTQDIYGNSRNVFSEDEQVVVMVNVSDPFGAYDIQGANASVRYQSNGTIARDRTPMFVSSTDPAIPPYWSLFQCTFAGLPQGLLTVNITANDTQGNPTWLNVPLTIVPVDHFGVSAPSSVVAGQPFTLTVTALDASNARITDWVGTVQFEVFKQDRITPGDGALSKPSVVFAASDFGQVNLTDESYDYGEESIFIRASSGAHYGWSGLISVKSGPVVSIWISPRPPIITAGSPVEFTATGNDSLSNVNYSWIPAWAVVEGAGTIVGSGLTVTFFGNTTGLVNLTCSNPTNGVYGFLLVQVIPGTLARIDVSASSVPLVIREDETDDLAAIGYDIHGNVVDISGATWDTNTSGTVTGSGSSAVYRAGFIPETGAVNVRLGGIVGTLEVVVLNGLYGPWILPIPAQIRNEDIGSWDLSLSGYWQDPNGTGSLTWWAEDVNTSLYFITHDSLSNAVMHFYTQPDQFGEDNFTLWVVDPDGFRALQSVSVRILPVNDKPQFINNPPTEIYVRFDTPYTFDYSYYVWDVDNAKSELTLSSSMPYNVYFDGLIGTFMFAQRVGESSYFEFVTLNLSDSIDSSTLVTIVRVTEDNPPSLNSSLPDVTIDEGVVDYFAFDLDLYFFDIDSEYLVYTSGFKNIIVRIDETTHEVFLSAPYEWSGTTEGAFTATDPVGALKVDTIVVTVNAVNDPPSIDYIPTLHVKYDVAYYLYLSSYVSDPDNSLDSLVFELSDSHVNHTYSPSGVHRLELLFPCNLTGPVYTEPYMVGIRMNVSDPQKAYAIRDFQVLVTDNTPPVVVTPNPDQLYYSFPEDTYLNNSLRLNDLFFDPDDPVLDFFISGWVNVRPALYSNGVVNLSASVNWSGTETLTIAAFDSKGGWAMLSAHVTVTEVNDAPHIGQIPDIIVKGGQRNLRISIRIYIYDSDDSFANLTIVPIQTSGAIVVGDELYVSLPNNVDVIPITLEATDGDLTSNRVTFKVGVSKTLAEKIGWPYSFPLVLLAAGVAAYFLSTKIPRPFSLENLFLIHNDGRLVTHVTREENTTLDKDVVSAMFTAVQEFVRDSFQKGEVGLKKLEIGDKNVVIEKGQFAYLALIYSGWPPKEVFGVLPMLMRDIEERFKGRLERWNGTLKTLKGVDKMLQDYMADSYKPGTWPQEEELAEEEWVDILSKEG